MASAMAISEIRLTQFSLSQKYGGDDHPDCISRAIEFSRVARREQKRHGLSRKIKPGRPHWQAVRSRTAPDFRTADPVTLADAGGPVHRLRKLQTAFTR